MPARGQKHSKEAKIKISAALKGKKKRKIFRHGDECDVCHEHITIATNYENGQFRHQMCFNPECIIGIINVANRKRMEPELPEAYWILFGKA